MMNPHRAGQFVPNLFGDMAYASFRPTPLFPGIVENDEEMVSLLVDAHRMLALLDGLTDRIPNINLFVAMYVRKEALLSSQIEGTQATLEDVLDPLLEENTNRPVGDVVNYIKATEYAVHRLDTLPLCNRLVRETHAVLMAGVRGQEKSPGEFRTSQNWIGGAGSTLKNARYIPPNPQDMVEGMSDLEKYIHGEDGTDHLIRTALIHYQFETIHPFLDGNGRVGRLLIVLYLMDKNLLSVPALYISCYLKQNRIEYYDRMSEVRRTGDYGQWVKFFLRAVARSAEDAVETVNALELLHRQTEMKLQTAFTSRKREGAERMLAYIEKNPIIEIQRTADDMGIAYNTAKAMVRSFCENGILIESEKRGRTQIYAYESYLAILRKDT